jgi:hypothetical protein
MPYSKIFELAAQEAQQAEIILLRKLLIRAYDVMRAVALEARAEGERDSITEALMRDISLVFDRRLTLL